MASVVSGRAVTSDVIQQCKIRGPVIGTHDATHHCDEVVACHLLKLLPEYKQSCTVRTRDQTLLDMCDVVVDNGSIYDAAKNRYDHHQQSFAETWSDTKTATRLSSAGLVWRHFGKRILTEVLKCDPSEVDFLHEEIYDLIFEAIDANDNGVKSCECKIKNYIGGMPSMGSRVGQENTSWCLPDKQDESKCFEAATRVAGEDLTRQLQLLSDHLPKARDTIKAALGKRMATHPSGKVVELDQYVRFHRFLRRFDSDVTSPQVEVVIYREGDETENEWRAVSLGKTFKDREPLVKFPEAENGAIQSGLYLVTPRRVIAKDRASLIAYIDKAFNAQ